MLPIAPGPASGLEPRDAGASDREVALEEEGEATGLHRAEAAGQEGEGEGSARGERGGARGVPPAPVSTTEPTPGDSPAWGSASSGPTHLESDAESCSRDCSVSTRRSGFSCGSRSEAAPDRAPSRGRERSRSPRALVEQGQASARWQGQRPRKGEEQGQEGQGQGQEREGRQEQGEDEGQGEPRPRSRSRTGRKRSSCWRAAWENLTHRAGFSGQPLSGVSTLLCTLVRVLPDEMKLLLGGLVFDRLNQGPSTKRLQKDLLPLPAWIPSAADIVEQSETLVTVIEARSRNAWLLLCIACINSHYSGGRSGSELLVCVGPPSPAQLSSLWRIWYLAGTLHELNPGDIAVSSIEEVMKGRDSDYSGNEICVAAPLTLPQVAAERQPCSRPCLGPVHRQCRRGSHCAGGAF